MDHEGHQVARLLTSRGIAGVHPQVPPGPALSPSGDAAGRAAGHPRRRAGTPAEFSIRSQTAIGVMGFSAGGHLASTAATLFDAGDAVVAGAHRRGQQPARFRRARLPRDHDGPGQHPQGLAAQPARRQPVAANCWRKLSTDKQVTAQTPPTFLFHTNEDAGVPAENSVQFYLALRKAGVPGGAAHLPEGRARRRPGARRSRAARVAGAAVHVDGRAGGARVSRLRAAGCRLQALSGSRPDVACRLPPVACSRRYSRKGLTKRLRALGGSAWPAGTYPVCRCGRKLGVAREARRIRPVAHSRVPPPLWSKVLTLL